MSSTPQTYPSHYNPSSSFPINSPPSSFQIQFHDYIHSTSISQEICLEMLIKSIDYWINVRGQKKLNVLDLGSVSGNYIYNLWSKAIKNFKGLEKLHLYLSNNTLKSEEFDADCMKKKERGEFNPDKKIVVHYVPSNVQFHDMKTFGFKDFKMNVITCWTETIFHHWQNLTGYQYFFHTLAEFIRPGGLFLYLTFDGIKLLQSIKTEYEVDPANLYNTLNIFENNSSSNRLLFGMSRLSLQNMVSAYLRHPQDVYLHIAFEDKMNWTISSPCAYHNAILDSISQKYGFHPVFRHNVARYVKYLISLKKINVTPKSWWDVYWEVAKIFQIGVLIYEPEEEHMMFEASKVFF
jgi:hypothetical protein